jgi:hypothetical protein
MSESSVFSDTSVSYNGQEVQLEFAIDDCFKKLQTFLNSLQCSLRSLCMLVDQDADYKEAVLMSDDINDGVDGMEVLFDDLKDIMSQVMIKPETPEEKEYLKAHKLERKAQKAKEIQDKKDKVLHSITE